LQAKVFWVVTPCNVVANVMFVIDRSYFWNCARRKVPQVSLFGLTFQYVFVLERWC
jgi:hypothetical protein